MSLQSLQSLQTLGENCHIHCINDEEISQKTNTIFISSFNEEVEV